MSRKSTKSQVAVERLLDERRQYEEWIRKLSAPGASQMPPHVVDRVRSDYRSRLEDVTRQLARYERELQATLSELELRRTEMSTARALREEALAEVRLRHTVGEFDEGRYAEMSADHTAQIAQLAEDLETTERDIARLLEVLGLVSGSGSSEPGDGEEPEPEEPEEGEPESAPAPPEPAPAPRARASGAVPAPAVPAPAIPSPRRSGGVAAPSIPLAPPPPPLPPPPAGADRSRPAAQMDALDELTFIRSMARSDAAAAGLSLDEESAEPAPPEPPAEEPPAARELPPPAAVPTPVAQPRAPESGLSHPVQHMVLGDSEERNGGSPPAHLASRGADREPRHAERPSESDASTKTLRCKECGTDNLPTEWYCEKCGAELSAF